MQGVQTPLAIYRAGERIASVHGQSLMTAELASGALLEMA
jgi:hypothetical protein